MINIANHPLIVEDINKTNEKLAYLTKSDNELLGNILSDIVSNKGKQIRPALTILSSKLKNRNPDVSELAAVIEICHLASLVHDDIIDNSELRRNKETVQKQHGPAIAVYTGDFMIFTAIARTKLTYRKWFRPLFSILEDMCEGEINQFRNKHNTDIKVEEYLKNIEGKTSALMKMACIAGGQEAKLKQKELDALESYGLNFGLMFQLYDDLLDFTNDELIGKTSHNDFKSGYYTLPIIMTFNDETYGDDFRNLAIEAKDGRDVQYSEVFDYVSKSDGFNKTLDKIHEFGEIAKNSLNIFPSSAAKDLMIELVNKIEEAAYSLNFQ